MKITNKLLKSEYKRYENEDLQIKEYDIKKWIQKISGSRLSEKPFGGCFYPKKRKPLKFKHNKIIIDKDLPNYMKLWVLYHEAGHYLCHEKKCKCMKPTADLPVLSMAEFHANVNVIKECIKHKYYETLVDFFRSMIVDFFCYLAVNNMTEEEIMQFPLRQIQNDLLYGQTAERIFRSVIGRNTIKLLKKERPDLTKEKIKIRVKNHKKAVKVGKMDDCFKKINKILKNS